MGSFLAAFLMSKSWDSIELFCPIRRESRQRFPCENAPIDKWKNVPYCNFWAFEFCARSFKRRFANLLCPLSTDRHCLFAFYVSIILMRAIKNRGTIHRCNMRGSFYYLTHCNASLFAAHYGTFIYYAHAHFTMSVRGGKKDVPSEENEVIFS